jgi:flagellar hook assembly protein FlgD
VRIVNHMHLSRIVRAATVATLAAAALIVAVWTASPAGAQAEVWTGAVPVETRTIALGQSLPVAPLQAPGMRVASDASSSVADATTAVSPPDLALDPGRRFTMLGILCDLPKARGEIIVRLRTSLDATLWSNWYEAPLERQTDEHGASLAFTEALWSGEGRYVQIRAQATTDAAPLALGGVRLVTLDTGGSQTTGELAFPVPPAKATAAVAGLAVTEPATAAVAEPAMVTRAEWGADESLRKADPVLAPVKMAFIHHTAGGNTYTQADAPALVRGIYTYHVKSLGWNDIGYNFLVDRFGTIYVGRYGGPRQGVVGAQVYGFNTGSTGISVIGTYTSEMPPSATLDALQRLLAWKLDLHGLDPLGTATMTCGATDKYKNGEAVEFPIISGHRDANYTECPGNTFHAGLPAIRKAVGGLFSAPAINSLKLSTQLMSPNGDGVNDTLRVSYTISVPSQWTVQLLNAKGQTVRRFAGAGDSVKVQWSGKSDTGATVADGVYTLKISAKSPYGAMSTKTAQLTIDTVAPRPLSVSLERAAFSPNGDDWRDACRLGFTPSETGSLRALVLDSTGTVRRTLAGWTTATTTAARSLTWAGMVERSGKLVAAADGNYVLRLDLRDAAGNLRRTSYALTVDRTLGFARATPAAISPNGDGVQDAARLGFTLTRSAAVTVTIARDGKTVRTLQPGRLAAGARSVSWDGRNSGGTQAASGLYTFTVRAKSTVGSTSAVASVSVDRSKPRLTAPAAQTITLGQTAKANVTPTDPYSAETQVWCDVTNAKGVRVARVSLGWVTTGQAATASWRPAARGVFTLTFGAKDRAGNREYAPARTVLTVR